MSSWPHCKPRKYMLARHSFLFFFLTINYVKYINKLEIEVGFSKKEGAKLKLVSFFFFFNRSLACSLFYVIFRSSFCLDDTRKKERAICTPTLLKKMNCWLLFETQDVKATESGVVSRGPWALQVHCCNFSVLTIFIFS